MSRGTLTVIGTGIKAISHITLEARQQIEQADKVLYVVADPITEEWIRKINPRSESLLYCYAEGKSRLTIYFEMVEIILREARKGLNICAVFYGHPGVFVFPSHEVIRQASNEGIEAHMLPGISSEDCLFADLGIDPATSGCQSYEATDFLLFDRVIDTRTSLILWQIGVVGNYTYERQYTDRGLKILIAQLEKHYGSDHPIVLYQASQYLICKPTIQRITMKELRKVKVNPLDTLYIPPKSKKEMNQKILEQLGLKESDCIKYKFR